MPRLTWIIPWCLASTAALADPTPCAFAKYKISKPDLIALDCGGVVRAIDGTARVSLKGAVVATGALSFGDVRWVVIKLDKPLVGNQDYTVDLSGTFGTDKTPLDAKPVSISTKPTNATISTPIALTPSSLRYGRELSLDSPVELNLKAGKPVFSSEDAPGVFVTHHAEVTPDDHDATDFGFVGTATIYLGEFDTPKQLNGRFKLAGVTDIFGQTLTITVKKRLAAPSSPKSKDDSTYYATLLHQAAVHAKPSFILDGKIAPTFAIRNWHNINLMPTASADIGTASSIGTTKNSDTIDFGIGLERFIRIPTDGVQGVDPSGSFVYETNYELAHQNALFVGDAQWFFGGTDNSLKQQNYIKYLTAKADKANKDKDLQPQDAPKACFGYKFQFFTGVETGAQVSTETAKATSGSSKVQVPGYDIFRVRPRANLTLEAGKITLTLNGTFRYLWTTENVYRQRNILAANGAPTPQVYLDTVQGFRPYGEIGLSYPLDDAGHYAITSTLKLGSAPPNFQRILTLQSGLTVKF